MENTANTNAKKAPVQQAAGNNTRPQVESVDDSSKNSTGRRDTGSAKKRGNGESDRRRSFSIERPIF